MDMKKGVFVGLMIISIMFITLSYVSAGWFSDLFSFGDDDKNLGGELRNEPATANVEVVPPSEPPTVVYVQDLGTNVQLNSGSITTITFWFYATQGGVSTNLPTSNVWNYVQGNVTSPGETVNNINLADCNYVNDAVFDGDHIRNYSCTISANYYDKPDTDWTIAVAMSSVSAPTNFGPANNSQTYQYDPTYVFSVDVDYINWTSISGTDTNKESDNTIIVSNIGNTDIDHNGPSHYLQINASVLIGHSNGQTIAASNFTGNGLGVTNYCSTSHFTQDSLYETLNFDLTRGSGSSKPLGFCLLQVPNVDAQNFSTDVHNPWYLENAHI